MKKKIEELEEEIDAMGQENEIKAAKWVKEKGKEWDQEVAQEQGKTLEILEGKTRYKFADYKRFLGEELMKAGTDEGYPEGWMHQSAVTDKGIVFYLRSPDKRLFVRAFTPTNIPKYDLVAIEKIIESSWVAIEKWEKEDKRDIILPSGSAKHLPNPNN